MMHMMPLPKEEKYRITCYILNNGTKEYKLEYRNHYYIYEYFEGWFFNKKKQEKLIEHYKHIYAYNENRDEQIPFTTKEQVLAEIEKHHGEKISETTIEYIIK